MLGEDWTGQFLHQITDVHECARQQYQATVEKRKPTVKMNEYDQFDPSLMQRKILRYERLLMRLSEDGDIVTMLLGGTVERPTIW